MDDLIAACAALLTFAGALAATRTPGHATPFCAHATCAIHIGAARITQHVGPNCGLIGAMGSIYVLGPLVRRLRLLLAEAAPGCIAAMPDVQRLVRACGHGAVLTRVNDDAPPSEEALNLRHGEPRSCLLQLHMLALNAHVRIGISAAILHAGQHQALLVCSMQADAMLSSNILVS